MSTPPSELATRLRAWFDHPRATQPSASASGQTFYFLSDRAGHPEAWSISATGGPPSPLLRTKERVGRVQPAPEGDRLVVASDVGGDEHWELSLVAADGKGRRRLTSDPSRIHEPGAWRDSHRYVFRSNARDVRFFDIYEIDLDGSAAPARIREEDALVEVVAARGDRLLLQQARTNIDAVLLLRLGTDERPLNPHSGEEAVFDADLAKDAVYAATNPGREFTALYRFGAEGNGPELVHSFGGDLEHVRADRAGRRLALVANDRGYSRLFLWEIGSAELSPVDLPYEGVVDSVAWLPDGATLLFDLSAPTLGVEIFRADVADRTVRAVTRAAGPMPGPGVAPALAGFAASDGLRVPYWLHAPPGTPRGTIVLVHGGPASQARPGFAPVIAFLVERGFRVVVPNVRGSLGYGRTYLHLDDVRRRMDSVRDLRDLADHLGSTPAGSGEVRPKFGIIGGSYGGFMVLSAISTYPALWAAAVDIVGIANFVTFLERTGPWRRKVREDEYGSLEHDREFLEKISPLHHADQIRAPLLVVHGANDPRVPIYEAEQIVSTLERLNVPVEFLRFEDEGHGLVRRENQVRAYARAAEFFERYLAPRSAAGGPTARRGPAAEG